MMLAVAPAAAQQRWQPGTPPDPYRQSQPAPAVSDPSSDLRRNLATVGTDPNNIAALVDSGRSALAMGDAQAALTFFSRADEVAPRDARIKAGMASAMTLLGQPRAALALFAEAQSLGAPEVEIASDRGLAHDLLGDPRAAQRDYALVLRRRDNDETRRRLALSLAISGQREPALRLLEPQTRRNDRAGWRTQAFVLALTGDAAGAARVASGTGPAGTAEAMAPFLGRLPALSPAQRAMAVHLGVFPSDGRAQYAANIDTTPDPGALAFAGGPAQARPATTAEAQPARDARAGQRRRGASSPLERAAGRSPRIQTADAEEARPRMGPSYGTSVLTARPMTRRAPRAPRPSPATASPSPPENSAATLRRTPPTSTPAAPPAADNREAAAAASPPVEATQPLPSEAAPLPAAASSPAGVDAAILAGVRPGDTIAAPGFSLTPQPATPAPAPTAQDNPGLSDIATLVNALPQDRAAAPMTAHVPSAVPAAPRTAAPSAPSRHWVQVAGNIERSSMAGELRRLRGRAPALLNGMQAWTAGGSRRLLVGPFGSARDAQAFVNQLRPRGIEAVPWSSDAGQSVERLSVAAAAARAAPERRATPASRERVEPQRSAASSRGTRGRGQDSRTASGSRTSRDRAETSSSRNARERTEAASSRNARGRGEEARSAGSARRSAGRSESIRTGLNARNGGAADTRSNRGASTVERRSNGNDARPSRRRSAPEQGSSPRRGRSN